MVARDCVARIIGRQEVGDLSQVLKSHADTEPIENRRFGDAGIVENAKAGTADEAGSPIFGVEIPTGYR